jgi:chitinase
VASPVWSNRHFLSNSSWESIMTLIRKSIGTLLPMMAAMEFVVPVADAATLPAPVPRVIISAASSWGTAADSWAGYTGQLSIWVPSDVKGGWTLKFRSAELARQASAASFWNTTASYDAASQVFTLVSPGWAGDIQANSVLSVGFNGSGTLDTHFALEDCTLNGQPCVATVLSNQDSLQTLANLKATDASAGSSSSPIDTSGQASTTGNTNATLEVLLSMSSSWEGGYSGNITIKNLSGNTLASGASGWQAKLKFPDLATAKDVFKSGPWNMQAVFGTDGTVTLTPAPWAAALAAGDTVSSGFNGGTSANLLKAASADGRVTIQFTSSVSTGGASGSGNGTTDPGSPPVDTVNPTPVSGDTGLPTGTVAGGFLFSPYKDVGISMNWNTNVMSTVAAGALTPLLNVLPTRVPAVTWAFATGECGKENWAGIAADALAAANVKQFTDANKNYVISTGGAAGAFTCSTPEGMRTFINRYASRNLVGVDFDIEAGQSAAAIGTLVQQVQAVQADYPNLRFSFTIATLGSSNGQSANSTYGDLNATGYNVLQALNKYPLTNYTINLMVMDFGAAGSGVCVVGGNGLCDMGQTAIQAAKNLTARFGVPSERIELTPMIGVNDVRDELFSLQDTDTLLTWSRANHLAGVHFWSIDRDTPCNQANASPICSSVVEVPTWGWTQRFISGLGL